ncbi:MAG: hypothetical protein HC903_02510 [Methylacidiphilales bacterium]|nr:hypothetical protein [Candidatus Methylacidiphilales bacterium]
MARNESLARIVMLLCFGTALLTMSVRLYTSSSVSSMAPMASSKKAEYLKTQKLKSQDLEAQNSTKTMLPLQIGLLNFYNWIERIQIQTIPQGLHLPKSHL